ncbi:MAG: molybdenum cofactor guanylyltransferase [Methanosarcinales archaeon]|nr:molybdenum cofactor guanylyltransferase [ANME-2 cluster archaeon]MDF1531272.1 molybdenum cofactor guanylyltransferase [ANME-2 cluster archaeon]MDW7776130.1 molybdenum cofactor guanylyltransferase [Methanosarcinales archaeon]
MRSALILAGGRGRRMGFREKALLPVGNRTILEKTIEVLETVVDEVVVSVRDKIQQETLRGYTQDLDVVLDNYHDVGPLAGILEGMKAAGGEYVFISACDMPYLDTRVVQLLFDRAQGHDAAIPVWENEVLEPLHAVYRASPMAVETEKAILRNDKIALAPIFKLKDVVFVAMEEIQDIDPDLRTFMNINTMEDISKIEDE